jgi:hypothetical protein
MSKPAMHPIHVSVCNLDLNDTENTISIKLFKDDFAQAITNTYQVSIPMEKADEKVNSDIISKYINECLQIEISKNKILSLEYKYSKINEDAIWLYFNAEKANLQGRMKIRNTLMLDLWDDQKNLLIINWKGKENGYQFNRNDVEMDIDLNN